MNGFELQKVLRAYDLIGDNFDDLLSFLLSQTSSSWGEEYCRYTEEKGVDGESVTVSVIILL